MGICIDKDVPCIVMEYMKGGSVATVIHKEMRQLNMKTLLKWVRYDCFCYKKELKTGIEGV